MLSVAVGIIVCATLSQTSGFAIDLSSCGNITDCFAWNENCYGNGGNSACTVGVGMEASCFSGDGAFPCAAVTSMYDDTVMINCTVNIDYGACAGDYCFPAKATVTLQDGAKKSMDTLKVGDRVMVGNNKSSEVYMFSHRLEDIETTFIKITTSVGDLMMTSGHYLYVNGHLATAGTVKIGDSVVSESGESVIVVGVSQERSTGLYNPHTMDGDIVVDGIITSTYTEAIAPTLAHSLLWPVRMLYTLGYDIVNGMFDEGSALVTGLLPGGAKKYN